MSIQVSIAKGIKTIAAKAHELAGALVDKTNKAHERAVEDKIISPLRLEYVNVEADAYAAVDELRDQVADRYATALELRLQATALEREAVALGAQATELLGPEAVAEREARRASIQDKIAALRGEHGLV